MKSTTFHPPIDDSKNNITSIICSIDITAILTFLPPVFSAKYWTNPQYFAKLTDPDDGDNISTCSIVVSLMQKNRRRMRTEMKTLNYLEVGLALKFTRLVDHEQLQNRLVPVQVKFFC